MTITDKQIEAAAEAGWQDECLRAMGRERYTAWSDEAEKTKDQWRRTARAIIEAAEAAAWCDDIGQAPKDGTKFVAILDNALGVRVLRSASRYTFYEDDGTDDPWEYGESYIIRWGPLPQPKAAVQSDLVPVRNDKPEVK